jgi:hypothetical protein
MFQKDVLRRDLEATLGAPKSTDFLLNAKREHGLRFLIAARPDQSLADVADVFHGLSERFEVEPLFPSPPFPAPSPDQEPAWSDTVFVATVYNVAFDDVSAHPWDIAHAARGEGGFLRVSPEVPVVAPEPPPAEASPIKGEPDPGWEIKVMKIKEAWAEIKRTRRGHPGEMPGVDVTIGHPDTGWYDHEIWDKGNLDKANGWNFVENGHNGGQRDCDEPLTDFNAGHGTAAASVMVASVSGSLEGVAPYAVVIPIRAVRSVVLNGGIVEVSRAIQYARVKKCRVISLSLGWYKLDRFLRVVIEEAVRNNIIVIAAAGQYVPPPLDTCEPASYPECIGVAGIQGIVGIDHGCKPWWISHRNPPGTVTISAPASPVWRAEAVRGKRNVYGNSHGTTFATAYVAGIAALWLSYHFYSGYRGNISAQACFKEHLQRTAARHWPGEEEKHFVGLVDAEQLIKTKPDNFGPDSMPEEIPDMTATAEVARLLGSESPEAVRGLLATALLGSVEMATEDAGRALEGWADEVVFILQSNPMLRMELSNQLAASTITAHVLRPSLDPFASHALRQQFIAAATAEG